MTLNGLRGLRWPPHLYRIGGPATALATDAPLRMGSKGALLARMANLGLRVPEAIVLGTAYTRDVNGALRDLFTVGLPALEELTGRRFGDTLRPLLISVRSGAPVSMPGMLETLLNIGLCDRTVDGMIAETGRPRAVWDTYRRLVVGYGEVVAGLPREVFEDTTARFVRGADVGQLDYADLRELTRRLLQAYHDAAGGAFPQEPAEQLRQAVNAVFRSWDGAKARIYRALHGIDPGMGTAVILQRMVFGNTGLQSGAGVGFTRDPATGEPHPWVDFLPDAQGEDVVSGRRNTVDHGELQRRLPKVWTEWCEQSRRLEQQLQDMQDTEFTVESGTLYFLQTRPGKRTAKAAARIALDLLDEGIIDLATARARIAAISEDDLYDARLQGEATAAAVRLTHGIPASPGIVSGKVVLSPECAQEFAASGKPAILVRRDADTHDIAAMRVAAGILTQNGAPTSHAAVVARQLGVPCIVGCTALEIDRERRRVQLGTSTLSEGDFVTLDGLSGDVYAGELHAERVPDRELIARWRRAMGA